MNKKSGYGDSPYCCFHPREVVVGVCAQCLKDRLLLLLKVSGSSRGSSSGSISLPKVMALGSSFLQRLDSRHHPAAAADFSSSSSSADDSFISIKFEDNGKASWDSHHKQQQQQQQVVVAAEHAKRGGVTLTRWRKQVVGRLLQLARWKRSGGGPVAGERSNKPKPKPRAAAAGRGWIRTLTLTRRRAADHRPWS